MDTTETGTMVQEAAALALAASEVRHVGANPFVIVPDGHTVHDLEKMLETPTRKRGHIQLLDVESFCTYVNIHKVDNETHIYGQRTPAKFTAWIDGDSKDKPGWKQFDATYTCPHSQEWLRWTAGNGKKMPQVDFAQFIEDNAPDCDAPSSADMIEIARSIEAKKAVNFASGVRLHNGQNDLTYEETVSGSAGKGKLSIPEKFTIKIPVFDGGPRYFIDARLRYRIPDGGGKLTMWYDLDRPHKVLEDAVGKVAAVIENLTGLKPLSAAV